MAKILLVEDDEAIAEPIVDFLRFQGHLIDDVRSGKEALLRIKISSFDRSRFVKNFWSLKTKSRPEDVRQWIARLRKKLHQPDAEDILKTVIDSGYKIDADES